MSVQPVSANGQNASTTGSTASSSSASTTPTLTATDFMKLLSTQMENQDPLQPMDPSQSMTQLAQFSSLQQMSVLAQTQSATAANSFLGGQVTITQGKQTVSGQVTGVDYSTGTPQLVVNGTSYPVSAVTMVQLPSQSSSSTSTSSGGSSSGN